MSQKPLGEAKPFCRCTHIFPRVGPKIVVDKLSTTCLYQFLRVSLQLWSENTHTYSIPKHPDLRSSSSCLVLASH